MRSSARRPTRSSASPPSSRERWSARYSRRSEQGSRQEAGGGSVNDASPRRSSGTRTAGERTWRQPPALLPRQPPAASPTSRPVPAIPPSLTPDALRAAIAAGRIEPLYLIEGTDELLKSELAALFSETIEPELRAFNVERLYGMDQGFDPMTIVEAVRTLPMMAPRRIVVVLQAEKVLNP